MISFLLLTLGLFFYSSFSSCFRYKVRLYIRCFCLFVSLFLEVGLCINFPLRTAFAASHRFWIIMVSLSCFSRNFLLSLFTSSITCLLFRNLLFNLHVFVFYTVFIFSCNWYLLSALWSEKMLDMISVFLNLLILDLWTGMWYILENVPCAFERNVFSTPVFMPGKSHGQRSLVGYSP